MWRFKALIISILAAPYLFSTAYAENAPTGPVKDLAEARLVIVIAIVITAGALLVYIAMGMKRARKARSRELMPRRKGERRRPPR